MFYLFHCVAHSRRNQFSLVEQNSAEHFTILIVKCEEMFSFPFVLEDFALVSPMKAFLRGGCLSLQAQQLHSLTKSV